VAFQHLAKAGYCLCPIAAATQRQKTSSRAKVEISTGITAPRRVKLLDRSKLQTVLQGTDRTRSSSLFSWHRVHLGEVPSFEDKEEAYCTVLQLINEPSIDQMRKKKEKEPRSFDRKVPHFTVVGPAKPTGLDSTLPSPSGRALAA